MEMPRLWKTPKNAVSHSRLEKSLVAMLEIARSDFPTFPQSLLLLNKFMKIKTKTGHLMCY